MASINDLYNRDPSAVTDSTMDDFLKRAQEDWNANYDTSAGEVIPEFSMQAYIDKAMNKDLQALSDTELQALIMQYELPSDTSTENIAERINDIRKENTTKEKELRDAFDQIQNNPDIQKEFLQFSSERKQRQAIKTEEIYRKAIEEEQQNIAKDQALKDSGKQAKEAWKNRRKEFLGDLGSDDPLFKLSGQDELEKVYKTAHNAKFRDEFIAEQYEKGILKKQYDGFDFSNGLDSLTDAQKERIHKDYDTMVEKRFERYMKPEAVDTKSPTRVPGSTRMADVDTVAIGQGPPVLSWEHGELSRRLEASPDLAHNAYSNDSLFAVDKSGPIKTGGEYDKSLNAYKSYLAKNIDNAKEDILGLDDFLSQREALTKKQINMAKKDLASAGHVLNSSVSDGIKAGSKFKGLKVAGAIAGGITALWALSEIYDE